MGLIRSRQTNMCPCLKPLDDALKLRGAKETFRGQAWSENCREWAYYQVVLVQPSVRAFYQLPDSVVDHAHLGTHDGAESGFVCTLHHDAIMGEHPARARAGIATIDPR
ncbi:hypothetical protein [Nibricoccus aquaticus]|uniref:hypothetical protein n=1 Tax=Nibricoccus aquaticus TaxID=2576891 RepID=UPI001586F31B|nr:hypothetical protein [Nibricoccus aquaticus]